MLTTLPLVLILVLLTYLRIEIFQIKGFLDFSDTTPIITATALVIGFMLSGIMADYKEGERLPGNIASALQAIDDCILADINHLTETDFLTLRQTNLTLCNNLINWLFNRENAESSYAMMQAILLSSGSSPAFKNNVIKSIDILRANIIRADVIRRTDFIKTGYALLDAFVSITLALLIFANFKNAIAGYLIVGSISLIYLYMIRLIRDLDNPFDYQQDGSCSGAAEVDYFPIIEAKKRLEKYSLCHPNNSNKDTIKS